MPTAIGWNSPPIRPLGEQEKKNLSSAIDRVAKARSPQVETHVSQREGGMSPDVQALSRAARDTVEGIAITQVVEAGLTTVSGLLTRLMEGRDNGASDSTAQTLDQVRGVMSRLRFNNRSLLSDPPFSRTFHLGIDPKETLTLTLPSLTLENLGTGATGSLADLGKVPPSAMGPSHTAVLVEAKAEVVRHALSMAQVRHQLEGNVNQLVTTAMNLEAAGSELNPMDLSREVSILKQIQALASPPSHHLLWDRGASSRLISLLD